MTLGTLTRRFNRALANEWDGLSPKAKASGAGVQSYLHSFSGKGAMQCKPMRDDAVKAIDAFIEARRVGRGQ